MTDNRSNVIAGIAGMLVSVQPEGDDAHTITFTLKTHPDFPVDCALTLLPSNTMHGLIDQLTPEPERPDPDWDSVFCHQTEIEPLESLARFLRREGTPRDRQRFAVLESAFRATIERGNGESWTTGDYEAAQDIADADSFERLIECNTEIASTLPPERTGDLIAGSIVRAQQLRAEDR